jgi:DNA repair exonuclease SbcCD nuclease subunit
MPKPIAVALGDIHLDTRIWTKLSAVTNDAFLGYEAFLQVAAKLCVPAVIVGDLFDVSKPQPELVRFHRRCMDFCQKENIPVFFLQGNHDKQPGSGWAAATHEWPQYIGDGRPFSLNGVQTTGLDYATIDDIEPKIRQVQTPLLFLHQAVKQALGFEGAWNCDLDWVPPCVQLTVLGDIHKPVDMTTSDGRKACYTGAGHARDIDQTGPKSVVVINDDLTYYREPIASRQIKKFYIRSVLDLAQALAWRDAATAVHKLRPLLWLTHTAEMAAEVSKIKSECVSNGLVLVHTEGMIDDTEDVAQVVVDDEDDISPVALLRRIVNPEKDAELFGFIAELSDDRQPIADIITRRKEAC